MWLKNIIVFYSVGAALLKLKTVSRASEGSFSSGGGATVDFSSGGRQQGIFPAGGQKDFFQEGQQWWNFFTNSKLREKYFSTKMFIGI